ncbi:hypothetical protein [Nonomuraea jiangxiensis]|uniref:Mce-associated membrane protein n=1 Tax=Nonomuraea jiangxiensis TaxID=633440 RepID=A0A1G8NJY2_9ACTN|nr:hypothetical protein [Nonomuraea jiangxiensis]SDI80544.1 hypothetical protein SAMN05421869_107147 [Nonomuraea jiangxiensis]
MAQPGDRRGVAFAAIVVVIAAVGIYLTMWPDSGEEPEAGPVPSAVATAPAPSSTPLATASAAPFDVYSYLPLNREQLAAAADLAERFTAVYGTFRYDEDPAAYAQRLKAYTTAELGGILTRTMTSAGTVEQNRNDEIVSTATGKVKEIRQIDKSSVVFVVTENRQVTAKSGNQQVTDDLAVTVSQLGTDWRIFEVLPATQGQDGDPG